MRSDPSLPLQRLPALPVAQSNPQWLTAARQACRESLSNIDQILADAVPPDQDSRACLLAIAKSLQWVQGENTSAPEMTQTVRRALQIFDRMSATGCNWMVNSDARECESVA